MSQPLELHGTPLSHFTRKIRILLAELEVPFTFVRSRGVMSTDPAAYAGSPLQRVPLLVAGDTTLFDSEHIARYLVARFDPTDRFGVTSLVPDELNYLAALNTDMSNEGVILLAEPRRMTHIRGQTYFAKLLGSIRATLAWLDERTRVDRAGFDWRDITLVSMWQHLAHYALVELDGYPRLAARVGALAVRPSVAATMPQRSLDEAAAAGWTPG